MEKILKSRGVVAGCALLDERLYVVWTNKRFDELLPPEAPRPIVGHHVREVSPFIESLGIVERLRGVSRSGEPFDLDTVTPAHEGESAEHWKRSAYRLPTGHLLLVVERFRLPVGPVPFEDAGR